MWGGITLEFEIVGTATDAIVDNVTGAGFGATSTSWSLTDVRILADVVTLDSALQNSYAEHVLSGKSLPIKYSTYITILQAIQPGSQNALINLTRAVSRLKTVFITFDNPLNDDKSNMSLVQKDFNNFISSFVSSAAGASGKGGWGQTYNYQNELEYQVQIGSKMVPEYPCRSASQAFFELKKSLGIHGSAFHSISPTFSQYINDHFIIGCDCENVLEAAWAGLNLKAGQLLCVRLKGANSSASTFILPQKIYITLQSDQILEIRDSSASVYD